MDKPKAQHLIMDIRFLSQPDRLKIMRCVVKQSAELAGCNEEMIDSIVLAVNEACMNVMQHTYKKAKGNDIILQIYQENNYLKFYLIDYGQPITLDDIHPRDLQQIRPGGLGSHFIQNIMDEVALLPLDNGKTGNCLYMAKKI